MRCWRLLLNWGVWRGSACRPKNRPVSRGSVITRSGIAGLTVCWAPEASRCLEGSGTPGYPSLPIARTSPSPPPITSSYLNLLYLLPPRFSLLLPQSSLPTTSSILTAFYHTSPIPSPLPSPLLPATQYFPPTATYFSLSTLHLPHNYTSFLIVMTPVRYPTLMLD